RCRSADSKIKAARAPEVAAIRLQSQGRACERTAEGGGALGKVPTAVETAAEDVAVGEHVERILGTEGPARAAGAGLPVRVHEQRDEIGISERGAVRNR